MWRRGSVVASWLLDLTALALSKSPDLANFSGRVSDSGEGRWTITAAIEEGCPVLPCSAPRCISASARAARTILPRKSSRRCASSSGAMPNGRTMSEWAVLNVFFSGSSLACPQYHHLHRDQAHSRLTSAITAPQTPRWRPPAAGDYASQPLTGTRRATLLGTCARARATRRHAPSVVFMN